MFISFITAPYVYGNIFRLDPGPLKQRVQLSSPFLVGLAGLTELRLAVIANVAGHLERMAEESLLVHAQQLISNFVLIVGSIDVYAVAISAELDLL